MTKYEFTFLLNEEAQIKPIKDLVTALSGKITKEDAWGQKHLAYPINKKGTAYYYSWQLELNQTSIAEFKQKLDFNEQLVRYLLLKIS